MSCFSLESFAVPALLFSEEKVQEVNNALCELVGVKRENLINLTINSLISICLKEDVKHTIQFPYRINIDKETSFIINESPLTGDDSGVSILTWHIYVVEKTLDDHSQYKQLISESPIATAIYWPDGAPKYFNKAYGKIWGAGSEIGHTIVADSKYNIFEDEQLREVGLMPFIEKGFKGETADIHPIPYNLFKTESLKYLGLDVEKYVKGHIFPVKDEQGNVLEVALILSDVTFQMQAEEILTQNHLKFRLLTTGLPGVIYEYEYVNGESTFSFISQGSIEMFGFSPEEIIRDSSVITSLIHQDDFESFKETSKYAAENALAWEWLGRFIIDGKEKWIEGKSNSRGTNPNVRYGMLLDVTDRILIERQSVHNELLFTQLFENSPLGLVRLDENHRVIQLNKGFTNIFGYQQHELEGEKLNDIIVPEEARQEAIDINTITGHGEVGMIESFRVHKNGKHVPVIIYGVPVSLHNETIGIYGIYVDITERKRIENELKVRNEELDNFVYKVSHDLRAPLSSVLGLVNLAKIEDSVSELQTYIGLIESRIKLLDGFINDVLSHSKNLKLEVEIGEIDLKKTIDQCFSDLSYLPCADDINKSVEITGEPFYCDQWRINEIFRNLVSNSIKYLDSNKPENNVSIKVEVDDKQAKVKIEDNGIGIPTSIRPRIFDMFYRGTPRAEGSGIGLYIVKNAIEKLGGIIYISSEEGKGTCFHVSLPNMK